MTIRPLIVPALLAVLVLGACKRGAPAPEADAAPEGEAASVSAPEPTGGPVLPKPGPGPTRRAVPGVPTVRFDPPALDFGILEPGGAGQGSVSITNTGAEPLRVTRSITSCGCTSADDLTGREIAPGESTTFNTTMKMKSGLGEKKEKITVWFEGYDKRPMIYYFKAEVSLPVRAVPPHMTAADSEGTPILSGEITLESRDGRPFRVLSCDGRPPDFVDFDPARDEPRPRYRVRWDLADQDRSGTVPWWWIVETDRPDAAVVDLRVRHMSTLPERHNAPWVPRDQRVVLGAVTPGQPVETTAKIEYRPNATPAPSTATVIVDPNQPFTAELLRAEVDDQHLVFHIRIIPTRTTPGLLAGQLQFGASGALSPLRVYGVVR